GATPAGARPRLSEGRERDVNQARVLGAKLRPAEARSGIGLEHGVGARGEVEEERAAARAREVERHAALGGVHGEPEERALGVGDAAPEGRAAARRVAAGRLDLHHVGAEVAEELAGEEAGLARQVEDASAVEVAGQRRHARWRKATRRCGAGSRLRREAERRQVPRLVEGELVWRLDDLDVAARGELGAARLGDEQPVELERVSDAHYARTLGRRETRA